MTASPRCLIVVPTLNEVAYIGALLDQLLAEAPGIDALVVVADGGSTDGTLATVSAAVARSNTVRLLSNPRRLQSAGINLAVERYGKDATYLLRIDAHANYPDNYCRTLVVEGDRTNASSVVVAMRTVGAKGFQAAAAAAQNGLVGTGGAAHRTGLSGGWVDHGHHALIHLDTFRAVGGYDESFSHNEDAELDHRIRMAGGRIWMTSATYMTYHPRTSVRGLWKQYSGYGGGRARNLRKHRMLPKLRQALPVLVGPAILLALLAPIYPVAALPASLWVASCIAASVVGFVRTRETSSLTAAFAAMVMHAAWSFGFWRFSLRAAIKGEACR